MPIAIKKKEVTAAEYAAILVGDEVIRRVRKLTPHGSENQQLAPDPSLASFLTKWVQSANVNVGTPDDPDIYGMKYRGTQQQFKKYPLKHAALVAFAGSGNCQDIATLTYGLCLDAFPPECIVVLVSGWEGGHWYVRVHHTTVSSMGKRTVYFDICVDAWPIFAQCVRTAEHFIGAGSPVKQERGLQGTEDATVEAQILAMTRNFAMSGESVDVLPRVIPLRKGDAHYNHQCCSLSPGDVKGEDEFTIRAYCVGADAVNSRMTRLGSHFATMLDRERRLILRREAPSLGGHMDLALGGFED